MKTNRQIKRDQLAALAYKLYLAYIAKGYTNQQAIDAARYDKRVLVSDVTMRKYIKLMEAER